jgi:hypothetical protein
MSTEVRETAAYAAIVQTLGNESHIAPDDAGSGLEQGVKAVFALYGVYPEGWQSPKPQAA